LRYLGLETLKETKISDNSFAKPASTNRRVLTRELYALPGNQILNRLLEHENPREMIQGLPNEDFLWLVKKIGEDDSLPLLKLASLDQWQYLLDLEIWWKDRLHVGHASLWLNRLQQADSGRLVKWLFREGEAFAFYHFFRTIEVVAISNKDEANDLPDGFFSLDGVFHIRVVDSEHQQTVENIIRTMARKDPERYQAFLLGLAGVTPAEIEEEMYRSRSVRLAEHGFLPFEEALSVYAPLDHETLSDEKTPALPGIFIDEETQGLVPVSPLFHAGADNILTEATSRITDSLFLDRIQLEFAGLCNQIQSADGLQVHDLEVLLGTCRKAAGYLNLALERLCGRDISAAERLLRKHSLLSIFRVGFGLAMKLKWEAERWVKESWFYGRELKFGFWGEHWGGTLEGLLAKRPKLYVELQEGEEYKDFEWLSELGDCLKVLRRLMVLDALLERLADYYQIDERSIQSENLTFHPMLFNLWARRLLDLDPCFSGISLSQVKSFFLHLRSGSKKAPYRMAGFEKTFIKDFMAYASSSDPEAASILKDTLALIWLEFREEYERVSLGDLDDRYLKFISITTPSELAAR
jgi:hypothetical protein